MLRSSVFAMRRASFSTRRCERSTPTCATPGAAAASARRNSPRPKPSSTTSGNDAVTSGANSAAQPFSRTSASPTRRSGPGMSVLSVRDTPKGLAVGSDEAQPVPERGEARRPRPDRERGGPAGVEVRALPRLGEGLERSAERVDEAVRERGLPAPDAPAARRPHPLGRQRSALRHARHEALVGRVHALADDLALVRREAARLGEEPGARAALDAVPPDPDALVEAGQI